MRTKASKGKNRCQTDDSMLLAAREGPAVWCRYLAGRAVLERAPLVRLAVFGAYASALPQLADVLHRWLS